MHVLPQKKKKTLCKPLFLAELQTCDEKQYNYGNTPTKLERNTFKIAINKN
jgi:hypothetical protein